MNHRSRDVLGTDLRVTPYKFNSMRWLFDKLCTFEHSAMRSSDGLKFHGSEILKFHGSEIQMIDFLCDAEKLKPWRSVGQEFQSLCQSRPRGSRHTAGNLRS